MRGRLHADEVFDLHLLRVGRIICEVVFTLMPAEYFPGIYPTLIQSLHQCAIRDVSLENQTAVVALTEDIHASFEVFDLHSTDGRIKVLQVVLNRRFVILALIEYLEPMTRTGWASVSSVEPWIVQGPVSRVYKARRRWRGVDGALSTGCTWRAASAAPFTEGRRQAMPPTTVTDEGQRVTGACKAYVRPDRMVDQRHRSDHDPCFEVYQGGVESHVDRHAWIGVRRRGRGASRLMHSLGRLVAYTLRP